MAHQNRILRDAVSFFGVVREEAGRGLTRLLWSSREPACPHKDQIY
jgi:hypothetical protein